MNANIGYEALSFDDLLLEPGESDVLPSEVNLQTSLTRDLKLNIPVLGAAMDTVTEAPMGIALAQLGGLGVIHRNLPIEEQADHVERVKRSESGMIENPIVIEPQDPIAHALSLMKKYGISGLPVVEGKVLAGIITNRDLRFVTETGRPVSDFMTRGKDKLVTVNGPIDLEKSKELMHAHRIEKLLRVNERYELIGLITIKDINKARLFPLSSKDSSGRLLAAAAVGTGAESMERIAALVEKGVDVIVIDTAHGHSENVFKILDHAKANYENLQIVVGNFATPQGVEQAVLKGADAVKVGMGPGSICTTRIISGVGVPQMSAIFRCASVAKKHGVPMIADGGIKYSGDVTKALAGGADTVMIGNLLAGSKESPGEMIYYEGRRYKNYRGMGSAGAMKEGSKDRYKQAEIDDAELIPEGIEGRVSYRGSVGEIVHQLCGGLRAGMGYLGARTIPELRKKATFVKITSSALNESHVHRVYVTDEAPNYRA